MNPTHLSHDCRRLELDLVEYAYGGLEPAVRAQVEVELAECPECRALHAGFAEVRAALDAFAPAALVRTSSERSVVRPGRGWLVAAGVMIAAAVGGIATARSWPAGPVSSMIAVAPSASAPLRVPTRFALPGSAVSGASTEARLARIQQELEAVIHLQLALQRLTYEARTDHVSVGNNPGGLDR